MYPSHPTPVSINTALDNPTKESYGGYLCVDAHCAEETLLEVHDRMKMKMWKENMRFEVLGPIL